MSGKLKNLWDNCVFHVDYRTGLTTEWTRGRIATVAGGTPHLQKGPGGLGMHFDGVLDYLTYGIDFTGLPTGNAERTVSALVDYPLIDNYYGIFAYGNNANFEAWSFSLTGSGYNYRPAGVHRIGGLLAAGTNSRMIENVNRLVFLTLTYDETNAVVYVNGIRDPIPNTGTVFDTTPSVSYPIQVGKSIQSARWVGTIYTASCFDKCLNDEEVRIHTKEIMNNPRTLMQGR